MSESENIKSLIISTVQELWEDKEALEKFLGVVRRSPGFSGMADEFGRIGFVHEFEQHLDTASGGTEKSNIGALLFSTAQVLSPPQGSELDLASKLHSRPLATRPGGYVRVLM
ncbi:hypothetical protein [Kitasatospora sp. NPDC092286]|uniref:hypothetical protein n=1 Tax=Kitasatospora sp. NPDC092286 TaxID=3364087 RepID=UPI00380884B1